MPNTGKQGSRIYLFTDPGGGTIVLRNCRFINRRRLFNQYHSCAAIEGAETIDYPDDRPCTFERGIDGNWYEINDSQTPWKMQELSHGTVGKNETC